MTNPKVVAKAEEVTHQFTWDTICDNAADSIESDLKLDNIIILGSNSQDLDHCSFFCRGVLGPQVHLLAQAIIAVFQNYPEELLGGIKYVATILKAYVEELSVEKTVN